MLFAIGAAVLYALSTPFSKSLIDSGVDSTILAGLLYLGAGIGMAAVLLARPRRKAESPERLAKHDVSYVIAMVVLDIAAPILLLWGLSQSQPDSVALLNNFEIVATALVTALFFREKVSLRLWLGILVITGSCVLLSAGEGGTLSFSEGSLAVLCACCCWGFENNCNRICPLWS